ncbi:hypothetical protein M885DRAFT_534230 [Pelagophyceae sp. CCMP2097]|nr:hypothetical protein M885DRAFT_534230 [Pelagophyceae sp. CCMP2097]|mmetsp:Transcript_12144/g.40522  ORF Transcript_12144/g.40522 Transcript_12144/m.40522 type:complete len:490 (-) Transcript_12144:148-1617(-)
MKRSFRDVDLQSLAPPLFAPASEAAGRGGLGHCGLEANPRKRESPTGGPPLKQPRSTTEAWDAALLQAYMVEAGPVSGPSQGLGMGLEILPLAGATPEWSGSWDGHREQMSFLYGKRSIRPGKRQKLAPGASDSAAASHGGEPPAPSPPTGGTRDAGAAPAPSAPQNVHDSDADTTDESEEGPHVFAARKFAEKTMLRRGFFASALKRQLEALRAENAALKRCAAEVLDPEEKVQLFAELGSESSSAVAREGVDGAQVARRDLALMAVVQAAQQSFVISDPSLPDNPIVWCSDAFLRLTGYARHDVVGRNCRFLQGPRTDPRAVARIRAGVDAATDVKVVLLNYKAGGETFWNQFFIAPLRDGDGRVRFFIGVQCDVTADVERFEAKHPGEQVDQNAEFLPSTLQPLPPFLPETEGPLHAFPPPRHAGDAVGGGDARVADADALDAAALPPPPVLSRTPTAETLRAWDSDPALSQMLRDHDDMLSRRGL